MPPVPAAVVVDDDAPPPGTNPLGTAAGPTGRVVTAVAAVAAAFLLADEAVLEAPAMAWLLALACAGVFSWPLTTTLTLTLGPCGVGRMGGLEAAVEDAGAAADAAAAADLEDAGVPATAAPAALPGDRAAAPPAPAPTIPAEAGEATPATNKLGRAAPPTNFFPCRPRPAPPTAKVGQLPLNQRLSSGILRVGTASTASTPHAPKSTSTAKVVILPDKVALAGPDVLAAGVQYGIPSLVEIAPRVGVGVVQFLSAVELALDQVEGCVRAVEEG